jgi:hypothetical protein
MAIWSHASGGIVDAMESAIALRAPTDLRDKIFHLETRIESVEDAPRRETEGSSDSKPTSAIESALEDDAHRKRAAEMQMWWDEAMGRNFDLPDGYAKVAVLLIKWDDELDELKTRAEVCVSLLHSRMNQPLSGYRCIARLVAPIPPNDPLSIHYMLVLIILYFWPCRT